MKTYKVLKECVIEGEYYPAGKQYYPSEHMSKQALKELKKYDFIERVNDQKRWQPEIGESYIFIDSEGKFGSALWIDSAEDRARYALGNCFNSYAKMKNTKEWLAAVAVLAEDTLFFEPNWEDYAQDKYEIHFDSNFGKLCCDKTLGYCGTPFIFASEDKARQSVEKHKKEWMIFLNREHKDD